MHASYTTTPPHGSKHGSTEWRQRLADYMQGSKPLRTKTVCDDSNNLSFKGTDQPFDRQGFIIARGGWWKPQAIHHPFLAQSLRQEGRTREVWLPRGSPNIYTGAMESRDAQPSARFVAWVVSALTGKISSKRKSTQGPKIATGSLFPILIWSQAAFYQSATQNVMHQHSILEN